MRIDGEKFEAAVTFAFILGLYVVLVYLSLNAPPKLGARMAETTTPLVGSPLPDHFTATVKLLDGRYITILCDEPGSCKELK